jgi:hypothetical protein
MFVTITKIVRNRRATPRLIELIETVLLDQHQLRLTRRKQNENDLPLVFRECR